jgi:hypothetical protein
LASADTAELTELEAIYTIIEPMPEDRADLRMGITVANGLLPHVNKGHTPKPSDFIPDFDGKAETPKPQQTLEEMQAVVAHINAAWS